MGGRTWRWENRARLNCFGLLTTLQKLICKTSFRKVAPNRPVARRTKYKEYVDIPVTSIEVITSPSPSPGVTYKQ